MGQMLTFNANSPFPLISPDGHSYRDAQIHSEMVDHWLGLDIEAVEKNLEERGCRSRASKTQDHQQLWIGLASRSLLTPYTEIRQILARLNLKVGQTVVDLGAAYGRMGFVINRHYPGVGFIGYEFVGERVSEGARCLSKFKNPLIILKHTDLSDFDFFPPVADFYFIYDFGTYKAIEKILHDLKRISKDRGVTVVGRGRLCRDLIERNHPWLSQVIPPEHHGHTSIYRSR